jgi:hypothetical protein
MANCTDATRIPCATEAASSWLHQEQRQVMLLERQDTPKEAFAGRDV